MNYGDCGVVDIVVSIVARLQAKQSGIRLCAGEKTFSFIQTSRPALELRCLVFKGYRSSFPRKQRGRSVNFTTHLHAVLRLRRVAILLLPRKFPKYLPRLYYFQGVIYFAYGHKMEASGTSEIVVPVCQMLVPVCQIISRRTAESYNFDTNMFYNFESLVDTEIMITA